MHRAEKQDPHDRDVSDQDNANDARRFLRNAEHVTPANITHTRNELGELRASILSPITNGNGQ